MRKPLLLLLPALLFACSGQRAGIGADAGSAPDAGSAFDAGPSTDAGQPDAGQPDAGEPDAGPVDAGEPDAGEPDAGPADAGQPELDAGEPDAGEVDAGPADAGTPDLDAGELDAGEPDAGQPELDAGAPDAGEVDAGEPDAGALDAGPEDAGQPEVDAGPADAGEPDAGEVDAGDPNADAGSVVELRLVAANITSGNLQSYDPGEGIRIFQGLHPDVVMIQEFNYGDDSDAAIRSFVDTAFGVDFSYYRGTGSIPNGVISRYPILATGEWADPAQTQPNRAFTWAQVDLPGPRDLWVISLHLLASSNRASARNTEAQALVADIQATIPPGDLLVMGGDLNTYSLGESAVVTLSQVVVTSGGQPVDQANNPDTSAARSHPYDHVFMSPELDALSVPVVIGSNSFFHGLVFDSRVYTPLADVDPVLAGDSGALNMQHMAVVREVAVPY